MASAVLTRVNESSWGQSGGGFMGKSRHSNSNPNPNPNPNPKSSSKKKKQFSAIKGQVNGQNGVDSPAVTQTASNDAYSFNQRSIDSSRRRDPDRGGYVSFKISSYSRSEMIELKERFVSELAQVRKLNDRIESGSFQTRSRGDGLQFPGKGTKASGKKRPLEAVTGVVSKQLCIPAAVAGANGIHDSNVDADLMKSCRLVLTRLMKQKSSRDFNAPVDAAAMRLHDYHLIIKHPMDLGTVRLKFRENLYSSPIEFAEDVRLTFSNALSYNPKGHEVYVMAEALLALFEKLFRPINEKLSDQKAKHYISDENTKVNMSSRNHIPPAERSKKPKHNPVPPNSNPMPPNSNPTHPNSSPMPPNLRRHEQTPKPTNSLNNSNLTPPNLSPLPPNLNPIAPNLKRHEQTPKPTSSLNHSNATPPLSESPEATPSPRRPSLEPVKAKSNPVKQPKPRAKDVVKREMSMEEKHRLGVGLQSLPQEKMPQLIQIIRKRNEHLAQEGDEIELDIESLDTETLWELDRFVTNWKKMESKTKRQALMVNYNSATPSADPNGHAWRTESAKKLPRKGDLAEEDVDIGDDEMPMTSFPPLEIEKDEGGYENGGRGASSSGSSSSSSSDSSSSNSDSGSSSGSDADAG